MLTKICKGCSQELPIEDFPIYKTVSEVIYRRGRCSECYTEQVRNAPSQTVDAKKAAYVQRTWNMPMESYDFILALGCEVCGSLEELTIDHDHSCCPGKGGCQLCIRGVLCNRHNLAEGNLRGNPEEAIKLAEYMTRVNESRKAIVEMVGELSS